MPQTHFHTASELAEGKEDADAWHVPDTGTTHSVTLKLQRSKPAPPIYRVTYHVAHEDGTSSDKAYLYDRLAQAQGQYTRLRSASPVPKGSSA